MTEPVYTDQPQRLLSDLDRVTSQRAAAEQHLVTTLEAAKEAMEKQYHAARHDASERHERQRAGSEAEYHALRSQIVNQFQTDYAAAETEYDETRDAIVNRTNEADRAAQTVWRDSRWEATTLFEASQNRFVASLNEAQKDLAALETDLQQVRADTDRILRDRGHWREVSPPAPGPASADPRREVRDLAAAAHGHLQRLAAQPLAAIFGGRQAWALVAAALLVATVPTAIFANRIGWYWIPISAILAIGASSALAWWLHRVAVRQSQEVYTTILYVLAGAEVAKTAAAEAIVAEHHRQMAAIGATLKSELARADETLAAARGELDVQRQNALAQAAELSTAARAAIKARHNAQHSQLEERYRKTREAIEQSYRSESTALEQSYLAASTDHAARYQREWSAMSSHWLAGLARAGADADAMREFCGRMFPAWDAPAWSQWKAATAMPPVVPFGQLRLALADIDQGMPHDARLMPARTDYSVPVFFPFRDHSLVLLKARDQGRAHALEAMRAVMLRMLTAFPPGKVRFLIVDPVGLGESFSAFMHLADFNEKLVSNRIWTETGHIEQRLAELTEHMENIIQVYLRNEFQSLQEYNESAGELTEPYRVLVVANFPANFSEVAARRLVSIVSNGARCGVYTLLSMDTAQPLPRNLAVADLQRHALRLTCGDAGAVWEHPERGALPLALESAPAAERFTELVRRVGREARDADRVELPFEWIIPDEAQWWTGDSGQCLDIPIGRAGVNKLQHLQLGKGTSQHVLIAGKTGSGKSTLLHVLTINAALRYGPDELELYLIDFKKGVEFKAYAEWELPHARVVAIESEREFGLSVLERLDWELKRRGELFREHNVQDVQAYRAASGTKMPRILLIVDEFQELFVEDDRIAQSATLLLDRLVRQGRAFGIHVLLGSQTLAGAYSIPRSTIGQMAVRIALQCSEADAHLILSEENTAARLLTRPGEAIYNDANGLYEGNHPFQVVWLADDRRGRYLQRLRQWAREQHYAGPPAIVFEGNLPADPAKNAALCQLLSAAAWPAAGPIAKAWLGEPVAIQEPTAATLVRQGRSHLLVVGHQAESAMGILATSLVSLAAQHPPARPTPAAAPAQFYVLDGTRPDSPHVDFWNGVTACLPHAVKLVSPRRAAAAIAEVAEELTRREQADEEDAPPIYLVVHDLGRFRDLRKGEDEFDFGRMDEGKPPSPSRQFRRILHDGPALGIHALVWADSYTTALRTLDRQGLGDMELRVVFRMNPGDSTTLIDSPAAGQLGVHRALFDDEGQGRLEKFRPYGPPKAEWLAWVKEQLHRKAAELDPAGPR